MTRKRIIDADGNEQTVYYENAEDTNTVTKFTVNGKTITSHSKNDSFGRKVFDELQLGTGFVSRQFSYHVGAETQQHKDNEKLKSSATTQLVSQIILSGGRTISYKYDKEERITEVDDSVDGITTYTYDALGQLLTETVIKDGVSAVVNEMTYSDSNQQGCYGNILSKNGVVYEYDTVWKDKLVKVGDDTITYDAQGNPLTYLGHTLTWEKGRQLKKFVKSDETEIEYTYNANGIRTSKTIGGIRHDFVLDGAKILRETWNGNTLTPLYDNKDSICGIVYNNTPYYFLKNQQGDVIAITDATGDTVARYIYDAWGAITTAVTDTDLTEGVDIASINPYRYRGYYYDTEIGMYYLQSRYYDPVAGRFVNADEASLLGADGLLTYNLFGYCTNNPIMNIDPNGFWVFSFGVSLGYTVIVGLNLFALILLDSNLDFGLFIGSTISFGYAKPGFTGSVALYWGFKKINDYLKSVTVSFGAGCNYGGALIYNYYEYPSAKKKFVGIQISFNSTALYRETAPIDGGLYIPLGNIAKILKGCGTNIFKIRTKLKRLKIKMFKR